MHNGKQVIASMTSYPARIENAAMCIGYLLTKQTVKPDEVHIWLADPDFPERKIPDDLAAMIDDKVVFLHWLPEDTYTHKKHEIFKIRKDFYCFLDDDTLIESTLKLSDEFPNTFINYTNYGKIWYHRRHQVAAPAYDYPTWKNQWCGQSMIPSWVYPMEALSDENVAFRNVAAPISEESWLVVFIVLNKIPVMNNTLRWGRQVNRYNCNVIGLCRLVSRLDKQGLNFRDRAMINNLEKFPELRTIYETEFNYNCEARKQCKDHC